MASHVKMNGPQNRFLINFTDCLSLKPNCSDKYESVNTHTVWKFPEAVLLCL